jgi:hypothetical protein
VNLHMPLSFFLVLRSGGKVASKHFTRTVSEVEILSTRNLGKKSNFAIASYMYRNYS